jgi:hypothetical protein
MPAPGALFGPVIFRSVKLPSCRSPLDGEWPEQIVDSRVAAFATQKIVSFSQSVPAEVSKLCVGATCHETTRLETCVGDEIRVWTLF